MLVVFAAKSLVIAGVTLVLLRVMHTRSAVDRSWIAHLGLAALAALPLGSLLFPPLEVASPYALVLSPTPLAAGAQIAQSDWTQTAAFWLVLAYAVPAILLIARMLLAMLRLVLLTTRAQRMTDDHWLSALTRAQRQKGLPTNTALLVSGEISSPISWGLQKPRILLGTESEARRGDADAILVHELSHVAQADWLKLMLARISVALFWFNPLVWRLAREAHQLREEAADDAVLAANIEATTYASVLVNVARHQSDSRLLGAHGVAPAGSSLARRVRRVLDRGSNRSAGGIRWAAGMAGGAAVLTAPLMTLQLTDKALVSSDAAPSSPDEDAGVVVFELRTPASVPDAVPAKIENTQ
ncbi:M56 family metallopeptidase [Aurantiacibacter flavus]|uniref:M56 family metallopeptidase n=1 Tax=Aurantiacibacter flavus TaxID=3145232 RepID=A0ABV0D0N8_9SPHN